MFFLLLSFLRRPDFQLNGRGVNGERDVLGLVFVREFPGGIGGGGLFRLGCLGLGRGFGFLGNPCGFVEFLGGFLRGGGEVRGLFPCFLRGGFGDIDGFLVATVFLRKNGIAFAPKEADATAAMLALAAGEVEEEGLARWIRDNWPASGKDEGLGL